MKDTRCSEFECRNSIATVSIGFVAVKKGTVESHYLELTRDTKKLSLKCLGVSE